MNKDYSEFTEDDCKLIFKSIINNKKHVDNTKTIYFLKSLKKIKKDDIEYVLKYAEIYYYHIKHFFNFDKDEKMFYIAKEVQSFKDSNLTCCLQVLDYENVSSILSHSLTIEHFVGKYKLNVKRSDEIKSISDYFFATGHVNISELNQILDLIHKNKLFQKIIDSK